MINHEKTIEKFLKAIAKVILQHDKRRTPPVKAKDCYILIKDKKAFLRLLSTALEIGATETECDAYFNRTEDMKKEAERQFEMQYFYPAKETKRCEKLNKDTEILLLNYQDVLADLASKIDDFTDCNKRLGVGLVCELNKYYNDASLEGAQDDIVCKFIARTYNDFLSYYRYFIYAFIKRVFEKKDSSKFKGLNEIEHEYIHVLCGNYYIRIYKYLVYIFEYCDKENEAKSSYIYKQKLEYRKADEIITGDINERKDFDTEASEEEIFCEIYDIEPADYGYDEDESEDVYIPNTDEISAYLKNASKDELLALREKISNLLKDMDNSDTD